MEEIEARKFDTRRRDSVPCFVYYRVSTKMQDYDRQVAIVQKYVDSELGRGYTIESEFMDKVSGADANRPQYKEMWSYLKARRGKVVICSSMDRFGRNLAELLKAVELAKKYDVELRFIKDRLIINNEESFSQMLILQLLGAVAEFESNIASERTRQKVDTLRENPFWWTGQKPKVKGEAWMDFVDMYYAKKPRQIGGRGPWKPEPTFSKTETSFKHSLLDIANHFNMSKGAVSDMVSRYVSADIMPHRSPKKAKKLPKVSYLKLDSHTKPKKGKKGSHSILHPLYWPENIKNMVSKKFGKYEKLEKFSNREQTLEAWNYGKKVYLGWMKSYVKQSIENAEIFAHHKDLMSGGDFGGLIDAKKEMSKKEAEQLEVEELADITKE